MKVEVTRLADACVVITKGTTPTTLGMTFSESGVPFVRVNNFKEGNLRLNGDIFFISPETHRSLSRSVIRDGDVLLSIAGTIGRSCVVPVDCPEANCNQAVCVIRPERSRLNNHYLQRWMTSEEAISQLSGGKVTGVIANLSLTNVRNLQIPLPPLAEQKRIAGILDAADALRAKRRESLAQLDSLLQSTFLDMFGDPVTNPKGWEVAPLGELIVEGPQNGLYKPAKDYGSGTRILRIDGFYDGLVTNIGGLKRVRITQKESDSYSLSEGNIVINRVNSREYLGKSAIVPNLDEPVVFESNMMRLRVDDTRILPRFAVEFLQTKFIKNQILTASKDAVNQSSINQKDVNGFHFLVPPLDVQKHFVSVAVSIEGQKARLLTHLVELDSLFASLQSRAFNGELGGTRKGELRTRIER